MALLVSTGPTVTDAAEGRVGKSGVQQYVVYCYGAGVGVGYDVVDFGAGGAEDVEAEWVFKSLCGRAGVLVRHLHYGKEGAEDFFGHEGIWLRSMDL